MYAGLDTNTGFNHLGVRCCALFVIANLNETTPKNKYHTTEHESMKEPYTYCSQCGDELPDWLQEKYAEENQSGPVLCIDCVGEIISGIGEALKPVMDAYKSMMRNALESLSESFNPEESE